MVRWLAAVLMVASCASASSLPEEGPAGGSGGKIEDVKGGAAGTTALPGGASAGLGGAGSPPVAPGEAGGDKASAGEAGSISEPGGSSGSEQSSGSAGSLSASCKPSFPAEPGNGCPSVDGGIPYCGPQCGTFTEYHACSGQQTAPTSQAGACQKVDYDVAGAGITVFCCEHSSCYQAATACPDGPGTLWSCAQSAKPPTGGCVVYGMSGTLWCCD